MLGKYLCLESSTSAPAQIVKNLWVRHEYVQGIQEADSGQWILCNIQTLTQLPKAVTSSHADLRGGKVKGTTRRASFPG